MNSLVYTIYSPIKFSISLRHLRGKKFSVFLHLSRSWLDHLTLSSQPNKLNKKGNNAKLVEFFFHPVFFEVKYLFFFFSDAQKFAADSCSFSARHSVPVSAYQIVVLPPFIEKQLKMMRVKG